MVDAGEAAAETGREVAVRSGSPGWTGPGVGVFSPPPRSSRSGPARRSCPRATVNLRQTVEAKGGGVEPEPAAGRSRGVPEGAGCERKAWPGEGRSRGGKESRASSAQM